MIASLKGVLIESGPVQIVIEAGGVGYEVFVPLTTAAQLPSLNESISLSIHSVYREDTQALYGFLDRSDRDFFRLVLSRVSGIGPKLALNLMSQFSADRLRELIVARDTVALSRCQGVGKKTAERLVVDLFDEAKKTLAAIGSPTDTIAAAGSQTQSDAAAALVALGFSTSAADKAVSKALDRIGRDAEIEEIVKSALSG